MKPVVLRRLLAQAWKAAAREQGSAQHPEFGAVCGGRFRFNGRRIFQLAQPHHALPSIRNT